MSPTTPSGTNSRCQTTYLCDVSQCSNQYQTQEELQDHISSKHHDIQSPNHTKSNPDDEKVELQACQAIEAAYHCNVPQCSIHFHTLEELHLHSASEHQDTRSSTHQKPGDSEDHSGSRSATNAQHALTGPPKRLDRDAHIIFSSISTGNIQNTQDEQDSTSNLGISSSGPYQRYIPQTPEVSHGHLPLAIVGHGVVHPVTRRGISAKADALRSAFGNRHKEPEVGLSLDTLRPPTEATPHDSSIRTSKCSCNPTPSPPATPLSPAHNNSTRYRVAFQARNGCAMLYEFELVDHDNRIEVMRKLQAKAKEIMLPSRFFSFIWRVVIETAIVEPINGTDIERPTPHAINLRNNMANAWLTQAFHDPESLDCDPDFNDYRIAGNSTQSRNSRITTPMKALVIRTGVNKSVMALLLMFSAAIACVIGILVGILASRADLGFGVACAVFALIAVLRELVVGYMKELGGGGRG